jgi:hypothetical protein
VFWVGIGLTGIGTLILLGLALYYLAINIRPETCIGMRDVMRRWMLTGAAIASFIMFLMYLVLLFKGGTVYREHHCAGTLVKTNFSRWIFEAVAMLAVAWVTAQYYYFSGLYRMPMYGIILMVANVFFSVGTRDCDVGQRAFFGALAILFIVISYIFLFFAQAPRGRFFYDLVGTLVLLPLVMGHILYIVFWYIGYNGYRVLNDRWESEIAWLVADVLVYYLYVGLLLFTVAPRGAPRDAATDGDPNTLVYTPGQMRGLVTMPPPLRAKDADATL